MNEYSIECNVALLERKRTYSNNILATFISFGITATFVLLSDEFHHWFIIPVAVCGALIGSDAIAWFRHHLDLLDPIGILGLIGFHFFFLAPLFHVHWDLWMRYVTPPSDWRPWLGLMACLNALGISVYRYTRRKAFHYFKYKIRPKLWILNKRSFWLWMLLALVLSAGLQISVYAKLGGILDYMLAKKTGAFDGMGWIFMLSEAFPILSFLVFIILAKRKKSPPSWAVLLIVFMIFFALKMLFGGLRGSRSNTIFELTWAVGIIHFWIKPVSRLLIACGLVFMVLFMWFYGFYKAAGIDALPAFQNADAREELELQSGRTLPAMLLGDLGRSDIQTFLAFRLSSPYSDYHYAFGQTYLSAIMLLIPKSIRPEWFVTKVEAGTNAQYGHRMYDPHLLRSSKVYGLAGEAALNFTLLAIPISFIVMGIVVGVIRAWIARIDKRDMRWLLVPLLIIISFLILTSDLDNIVFFMVKNGFLPFTILSLSCSKKKRIMPGNSL